VRGGALELAPADLDAAAIEQPNVGDPAAGLTLERDHQTQVDVGGAEHGTLEPALDGLLERRSLDTRLRALRPRHFDEHTGRCRFGMSASIGEPDTERESESEARAPHGAGRSLSGRGRLSEVVRWFGLAAALGVLGGTLPAKAAEPVRFQYVAADGCPNASDFAERVRQRFPELALATEGELARNLAVTISPEVTGGVAGRLDFVDTDGVNASRVVRGETCDEVVSSMALVTALALGAPVTERPPLEATEAPRSTAPTQAPTPAPPPAPAAQRTGHRPVMAAGFGAGYLGWAGPHGGLGLDALFDVAFGPGGPTLRLSAWHWRATASSGGRAADFRGWGGRLERCPFVFATGAFFTMPCFATNLGYFRGEGVPGAGVAEPHSSGIFWADVLLIGRVGLELGHFIALEAQGDLEFPLVRHTFVFRDPNGGPPVTVYAIPVVSGGAEGHLVVRFR
jgi:hypothetical protein